MTVNTLGWHYLGSPEESGPKPLAKEMFALLGCDALLASALTKRKKASLQPQPTSCGGKRHGQIAGGGIWWFLDQVPDREFELPVSSPGVFRDHWLLMSICMNFRAVTAPLSWN